MRKLETGHAHYTIYVCLYYCCLTFVFICFAASYCHVFTVAHVTKMSGSSSDDWIHLHLGYTLSLIHIQYRQCSAIADLHTFQSTVTHALGFSVSTSRLPATDLNTDNSLT
jgi:hypothetical protein